MTTTQISKTVQILAIAHLWNEDYASAFKVQIERTATGLVVDLYENGRRYTAEDGIKVVSLEDAKAKLTTEYAGKCGVKVAKQIMASLFRGAKLSV